MAKAAHWTVTDTEARKRGERRREIKSVVKVCGSTVKLQLILVSLSAVEAGGIRGVSVFSTAPVDGAAACQVPRRLR